MRWRIYPTPPQRWQRGRAAFCSTYKRRRRPNNVLILARPFLSWPNTEPIGQRLMFAGMLPWSIGSDVSEKTLIPPSVQACSLFTCPTLVNSACSKISAQIQDAVTTYILLSKCVCDYSFTQLSSHCDNIATERSWKWRLCPPLIESLGCFFIEHGIIGSTAHLRSLNN